MCIRDRAGAIFGSVLWLIGMVWLTVTAGRKPKDEEIHLNGYDRWYTEIAAGAVIGIWLAGTIISGTLIANSSLGYSHAVVTVIAVSYTHLFWQYSRSSITDGDS